MKLVRVGQMRQSGQSEERPPRLVYHSCMPHPSNRALVHSFTYCVISGDVRCNEQPQLTVMHTLWMREHNRVASQLQLMNSHWEDERLYQVSTYRYFYQRALIYIRDIFLSFWRDKWK